MPWQETTNKLTTTPVKFHHMIPSTKFLGYALNLKTHLLSRSLATSIHGPTC